MDKNLVEIISIVDRSGSMQSLTNDTIGGYNDFIEKQKSNGKNTNVSLVLFDDKYEMVYDCVTIQAVKPLDNGVYFTRGTTALLDAIGKTINTVGERLSKTDESKRPSKVIVLIITDGEENASAEFKNDKIKEMVKHQTDLYSWEFIFLGANIDSFGVSSGIGMFASNTANYKATPRGMKQMFANVSVYTSDLLNGIGNDTLQNYIDKEK